MSKLTGLVELVQDAIDKGATSVEQVQKAILNQPFAVLERIESLKEPAQAVREIQDRTIGSVYDVIRTVNQEVSNLAKDLLGKESNATHETEGD